MNDIIKGQRKIIYLSFPPESSNKPVMCNLTRMFDLTFNLLQASINPRQEGSMTVELSGSEANFTKGVKYLAEQGIKVQSVAQKISRDEEKCIDCGLCTSLCASEALYLDKASRTIQFDSEKCTACGLCTRICPVDAMNVQLDGNW